MEEFKKILLLTCVCCMACDGEIVKEEVSTLKKLSEEQHLFEKEELDEVLPVIMNSLEKYGYDFVKSYLNLLEKANFDDIQALQILEVATRTIYADNKIEYDEIKFFKSIRKYLKVTDEQILSKVDGVEDYWLSEDAQDNNMSAFEINFSNVDYNSLKIE